MIGKVSKIIRLPIYVRSAVGIAGICGRVEASKKGCDKEM